jgi:hypothetical protein
MLWCRVAGIETPVLGLPGPHGFGTVFDALAKSGKLAAKTVLKPGGELADFG